MQIKEISDRVKNIILHPKQEWNVIQFEQASTKELLLQYIIPIAGVAAIATFIGYGAFGINTGVSRVGGFRTGIILAINQFIGTIGITVLGGYIIDALAPYHRAEKNLESSMQLMVYAYTPVMIGNILNIIPSLSMIGNIFGLYGVVLLYFGITPMKHVSQQKKTVYLILILFAIFILNLIIGYVLNGFFGDPYSSPNQSHIPQSSLYST